MLTEEQAKGIKIQLIEQIEKSFPEEKKEFAVSRIESMDPETLESFLIKNGIVKQFVPGENQCVFCSIISGNIKSYKVDENSKAIAVLEINPFSRGHTIIIPKEHINFGKRIPEEISSFVKEVSKKIRSQLTPEKIIVSNSNILGHEIVNIIPVYTGQKELKERYHASNEELEEIIKILTKKKEKKKKRGQKELRKKKLLQGLKKNCGYQKEYHKPLIHK